MALNRSLLLLALLVGASLAMGDETVRPFLLTNRILIVALELFNSFSFRIRRRSNVIFVVSVDVSDK